MEYKYKLSIIFIILWILSAIKPNSTYGWMIENILVVAFIAFLYFTRKKFILSNLSHTLIFLFLSLHILGSHYMYSEVPFGFWLQDFFSLARNPFDRIVHFSFGLLLAIPFREMLSQINALGKKWQKIIIVIFVTALGAIYEIFEAGSAMFMNPTQIEDFTGTQGDIWDPQKDMILATIGSAIAVVFHKTKITKKEKKKTNKK